MVPFAAGYPIRWADSESSMHSLEEVPLIRLTGPVLQWPVGFTIERQVGEQPSLEVGTTTLSAMRVSPRAYLRRRCTTVRSCGQAATLLSSPPEPISFASAPRVA